MMLVVPWPSGKASSDSSSHGRLTPTTEQVKWIKARDRIGVVIDSYLATEPPPPLRVAVRSLEHTLADLDRAAGL